MNYDSVTSVKRSNAGVVKNVFVHHGDYVKSGQIIARIENFLLLLRKIAILVIIEERQAKK